MKKLKVKKSLKVLVPSLALALTLSLVPAAHLESSVLAESTSVSTSVESSVAELKTNDNVVVAADEDSVITLTESDFKVRDGVLTGLEDSVNVSDYDSVIIDLSNAENITAIKDGASFTSYPFYSICEKITEVRLPSTLQSIGERAFQNFTRLESIEIPASVTRIGNYAFYACSSLKTVTFEEESELTSIGNSAFTYCTNLESIEIPASVTSISAYAFYCCTSLGSIEIPASVTKIGDYAFYTCSSLKSIDIPAGVTSIDNYAFAECTSLESVKIPASVTRMGYFVSDDEYGCIFKSCTSLKSVIFEEGSNLTSIGMLTFYGCTGLKSIEIPASVESIDDRAFSSCSGLTTVTFAEGSKLTSIGGSAFNGCSGLKSIEIPASVTRIDDRAFSGCSGLESIEIPASVTKTNIGNWTFSGCTGLKSIKIPASVTRIDDYAFSGCSGLTAVTFAEGSKLTSIANYAFNNCTNLKAFIAANAEDCEKLKSGALKSYKDLVTYAIEVEFQDENGETVFTERKLASMDGKFSINWVFKNGVWTEEDEYILPEGYTWEEEALTKIQEACENGENVTVQGTRIETPTTTDPEDSETTNDPNVAAIAGGVTGGVAGAAAVGGGLWWLLAGKKKKKKKGEGK